MDLALHKRRLVIALAVTGACFLAAIGAIIAGIVLHADDLTWAAVGAAAIGIGAQIWFIVGFIRERAP